MDKIFTNNGYRILELFMEHPTTDYSARGIARELNLSHATVIKYVNLISKLGLIKTNDRTLYDTYFADATNEIFKLHKKNYVVYRIIKTGLVQYLRDLVLPSSIVLFGSCAKGTFTQSSDVDIFIEARQSKLNLTKFEKRIGKHINPLFEQNIRKLSGKLRVNIINGVVLYGSIS